LSDGTGGCTLIGGALPAAAKWSTGSRTWRPSSGSANERRL